RSDRRLVVWPPVHANTNPPAGRRHRIRQVLGRYRTPAPELGAGVKSTGFRVRIHMAHRLHVLRAGKRAQFLSLGARVAKEKVTRGMRARLGLALPLVAALIAAGCGGLGTSNGSLCPAPTLEPVTTPGGSGASVTSGFRPDRAYP